MSNSENLELATTILYQAISSPLGLVLRVSDFTLAQTKLYEARRKIGDPALSVLQVRRAGSQRDDDTSTLIWLVKSTAPKPTEGKPFAPQT